MILPLASWAHKWFFGHWIEYQKVGDPKPSRSENRSSSPCIWCSYPWHWISFRLAQTFVERAWVSGAGGFHGVAKRKTMAVRPGKLSAGRGYSISECCLYRIEVQGYRPCQMTYRDSKLFWYSIWRRLHLQNLCIAENRLDVGMFLQLSLRG